MWATLENVFYIVILLLFLSTFLPKPMRTRVRESLGAGWRVLPHLWRAIEPHAYQLVTGRPMPTDDPPARSVSAAPPNRTPVFAQVRNDIPRSDAVERAPEPVRSVHSDPDSLILSREEIGAVARMIEHKRTAQKPTKSSTVYAGFGLKRGGGPRYERASEIYDRFFAPPDETMYPTLIAQREQASREVESI